MPRRRGEGEHRYVLMFLCSPSDPGWTVLPTHRLVTDLDENRRAELWHAIERDFHVQEVEGSDLEPRRRSRGGVRLSTPTGAVPTGSSSRSSHRGRGHASTSRTLSAARHRGARGGPAARRARDVARRHLHQRGLAYSSDGEAVSAVRAGDASAAFLVPPPRSDKRPRGGRGGRADAAEVHLFPKGPNGAGVQPLSRSRGFHDAAVPAAPWSRSTRGRATTARPASGTAAACPSPTRGPRPMAPWTRPPPRWGWRRAAAGAQAVADDILALQRELFVVGAELATSAEGRPPGGGCVPGHPRHGRSPGGGGRSLHGAGRPSAQVRHPGGSELSARLDLARTALLRRERRWWT